MLEHLNITNLTVLLKLNLQFFKQPNLIVGENGTSKKRILKMAYDALTTSWEEGRKPTSNLPIKALLQKRLAEKLLYVFHPELLEQFTRRRQGRERCDICLHFQNQSFDFYIERG